MDQQNTNNSDYEAKRLEREAEEKARGTKMGAKKITKWLITIIVIGALSYGIYYFIKSGAPTTPDLSTVPPVQEGSHIAIGTTHPPYSSNPPTSGPHYPQTARNDFYTTNVPPDEYIVHDLEHGDIWISFNPRISESAKAELKKLQTFGVIITARPVNQYDISVASWGRLDSFNLGTSTVPTARIRDFITRYSNQGPEKIPANQHDSLNFN